MRRLLLALLISFGILLIGAGSASAIDIAPGDCKPPPVRNMPDGAGEAGDFINPPAEIPPYTPDVFANLDTLYTQYGVSGYETINYDLGCGIIPLNWNEITTAQFDSGFANQRTNWSLTLTAMTHNINSKAWNPTWITEPLTAYMNAVIIKSQAEQWAPYLALGILAAVLVGLARHGMDDDIRGAAVNSAGVAVVLLAGALILLFPMGSVTLMQKVTQTVTEGLYDKGNPADAIANNTMKTVHYPAWADRSFGDHTSKSAQKFGPELFPQVSTSWAEQARIKNGEVTQQVVEVAGQAKFAEIAGRLQAEDPSAYRWLQGKETRRFVSNTELYSSISINLFAIISAGFVILAQVVVVILAAVLLFGLPWLVQPHAALHRRALYKRFWRAFGVALSGIVLSWLWSLYASTTAAAVDGVGNQFIVLALGTLVFLGFMSPFRSVSDLIGHDRDIRSEFKGKHRAIDKIFDHLSRVTAVSNGPLRSGTHRPPTIYSEAEPDVPTVSGRVVEPNPFAMPQPKEIASPTVLRGEWERVADEPPPTAPSGAYSPDELGTYHRRSIDA